jgi:L-arabinose isomerase
VTQNAGVAAGGRWTDQISLGVLASSVPRDVVDDAVAASGRQELPALEMPYGQFRPVSGVRDCLNGWLAAGGPHHEVMNLGHHPAAWRDFCQLAGIELVQV